jgi:ketosteroid isomerase-like protein
MRTIGRVSFGLAVIALVMAASASRANAQCGGAAAPLKAVADAYVKAVLAADVKAVVALYTEDAVEMPPDEPLVKGRAALEAMYKKEFTEMAAKKMKIAKFTLTHLETVAHGDMGHDIGTFSQTVTAEGGAKPMNETGKYVVLLKQQGGTWKVAYAIYNRDAAPPMEH